MRSATITDGSTYILYDADAAPSVTVDHFDMAWWDRQGSVVGRAPGRGQVCFVQAGERVWALRHYRRGGLVARLSEDFYLWTGLEQTRAWREFRLTAHLHRAGLPVPRAIAAHVRRHGWRYRADLITERITGAVPLADLLAETPLPAEQWAELGRVLRRFHDAGLRHDDINGRNVLRDEAHRFYLIDFDKAIIVPAGAWREKNLSRFRRSLEKFKAAKPGFRFADGDWAGLLAGYASSS